MVQHVCPTNKRKIYQRVTYNIQQFFEHFSLQMLCINYEKTFEVVKVNKQIWVYGK